MREAAARPIIVMVAGSIVVAGGLVGTADAASAPRVWKVAGTTKLKGNDDLGSVVATGKRSAWAVGTTQAGGKYGPLVTRWNGSKWRKVTAPALPGTGLSHVDGTSDKNIWTFGTDLRSFAFKASHWNGSKWSSKTIDDDAVLYDVDVVSASNIWLAGNGFSGNKVLKHYNGKTWKSVSAPGSVFGLDVPSSKRGWAVGGANNKPLTLRWNGKAWKSVPVPRYTGPSGSDIHLTSVVDISPTNAWAVGTIVWQVEDDEEFLPIAIHWNGKKWSKVAVPSGYHFGLNQLTRDGSGGLWMQTTDWSSLINYRSGKWTQQKQPTLPRSSTLMYGLANVPGTTTMLGVGAASFSDRPENDRSDGVYFTTR